MRRLIPPDGVTIEITEQHIFDKRVPIPINLALRNRQSQALVVDRVEIAYGKDVYGNDLDIKSGGRQLVDPDGTVIVYEHDIGTLSSIRYFTPLETIDTIYLPYQFVVAPVAARSREGVPIFMYVMLSAHSPTLQPITIPLNITVYAEGRPPVHAVLELTLRADVEIFGLADTPPNLVAVTSEDVALFAEGPPANATVLDEWAATDVHYGEEVTYQKLQMGTQIVQFIHIAGTRRSVIVDSDADGYKDYELWDMNSDGVPDQKAIFKGSEPMLDWLAEGVAPPQP